MQTPLGIAIECARTIGNRKDTQLYNHYTMQGRTSKLKKLYTNQYVKRSLFSVREGKFIGTLGLLSYLKKKREYIK